MRKNLVVRMMAIAVVAMFTASSYAQVSFQVVQGDVKTYTANINSTGHPAAGITFGWSLTSPGVANPFTNSGAVTQNVTWSGPVGAGYVLTVTPSYGGCPFAGQAKFANIEILSPTIDIAWTAPGTTTVCSQTALSTIIGVTATGITFATGNVYTIEYSIDGAAVLTKNVTFVNGATTGTVDFSSTSFTNLTAVNGSHTVAITRLRVNGGSWVDPTDHNYTVTVTPEPVLNDITSN
jgi:hypothetical protein